MIVLYHQNNKVVSVSKAGQNLNFSDKNPVKVLFEIANAFPNELVIWCSFNLKSNVNFDEFDSIFHHQKMMVSYNPFENSFLPDAIGYIEESVFINLNKKVTYPTWQMSSFVGGIQGSVLLALKENVNVSDSLDYFLLSLAKLAMPHGLLCYSDPKLLKGVTNQTKIHKKSYFILFRFVKQHYKMRWIFLLFLNFLLYEKKITLLPLIYSLFYSKRKLKDNLLKKVDVQSIKEVAELVSIDVIIPTIGRKEYLYHVLKDLSQQTYLPKNVIIVEQNPNLNSISELDYLKNEIWDFEIKHIFTHQAGACNARNLALFEVKSEWVFMADDDIRFENHFLEKALNQIKLNGIKAATFNCFQKNEKIVFKNVFQWPTFGSGCSIVQHQALKNIKFNMKFEFGFGEDADFGMQLRNQGNDIIYFSEPGVLHLKAPIGGFRSKPVLPWQGDKIPPKPSPTIMLYKQLHLSKQQLRGYKTILFFKYYKIQSIKNLVKYFFNFKKQWKQSEYWANELNNKK
ncbi:glycosyltransferase family 2 protein [Flavobacterium limi]|uniref:Glycosyl transferase n=1 Tax=Flavobacterium limi TaxID=2045105 RepID=A0ABQ1U1X7_9FLAO|nr:glycosyltransferase family A protein [Flavobacterium limi]GGF08475.1 glycosyl transferase [Flavobacterium limi]